MSGGRSSQYPLSSDGHSGRIRSGKSLNRAGFMKRSSSYILILLLSFAGACVPKQKYQALQKDYQEVKEQRQALKREKQRSESRKEALKKDSAITAKEIEELTVGIALAKDSIDSIQALEYDMKTLRAKYERTKTKIVEVRNINDLLLGNVASLRRKLRDIGEIAFDTCSTAGSRRDSCFMKGPKEFRYRPH